MFDGGPVLIVFGSFFPAWILCLVLGLAAAGIAGAVLRRVGLAAEIPVPVVFYGALTAAVALGLWYLAYGGRG